MAEAPAGTLDRGHPDTVLRASEVSRFAFSSPTLAVSAAAASFLALLEFALFAFGPSGMDVSRAATAAFAGVLFPSLLGAVATLNFYRQIGGTITPRRCAALAATDLAIIFAFTLMGSILPSPGGDAWKWAVLAGAAFAASVNMIVLAGTADPNLPRALAAALSMPAGSLAVLFGLGFLSPVELYLGILFVLVFAACSAQWIRIVVAPFQRNFHEDGLGLLHAVLDAWAGWSKSAGAGAAAVGTLKMEAFFARHGEPKEVRFDALTFAQVGGRRLLWFIPELHPGPYGDLGGSDLPSKAAAAFSDFAKDAAVFHGPSTHDENPTGREQLAKVFAEVKPALASAKPFPGATKAVAARGGSISVVGQRLGGALVLTQSRAPLSSDDLDVAVGREIRAELAEAGVPRAVLLDGHNSVAADLGRIHAGSPDALELGGLCQAVARELSMMDDEALAVGWHAMGLAEPDRLEYAIGSQGILATVTKVETQKMAWVLIDGNNLKGGLRADMLEALKAHVELAEIFTTDNHAVNATMGADNEVGSRRDNTRLVAMVEAAVERAVADLKPAEVAAASGAAKDVQVFGPGLTVKMTATINAAVSVMIPAYVATTSAAILGCLALAALLTR